MKIQLQLVEAEGLKLRLQPGDVVLVDSALGPSRSATAEAREAGWRRGREEVVRALWEEAERPFPGADPEAVRRIAQMLAGRFGVRLPS